MLWLQNNQSPSVVTPAAGGILFHKATPGVAAEYNPGESPFAIISPTAGYTTLLPMSWTLPAIDGTCRAGLTFNILMPDGSGFVYKRYNTGGAPLTETVNGIISTWPLGNRGKIIQVYLHITNSDAAKAVATLGEFTYQGFQV
jgi:hypothetical protein